MGKSNGDYEVGYGKPPVGTRFKKGQSGNPRGRAPKNPIKEAASVIDDTLRVAKALETLAEANPDTIKAAASLLRRAADG